MSRPLGGRVTGIKMIQRRLYKRGKLSENICHISIPRAMKLFAGKCWQAFQIRNLSNKNMFILLSIVFSPCQGWITHALQHLKMQIKTMANDQSIDGYIIIHMICVSNYVITLMLCGTMARTRTRRQKGSESITLWENQPLDNVIWYKNANTINLCIMVGQ